MNIYLSTMKLNISEKVTSCASFSALSAGFVVFGEKLVVLFGAGWNRTSWGERDLRGNIDPLKKSGEIKESTEYEMSILYMKERLL